MSSHDKIILEAITCRCRIGVPAAERRRRQTIHVDAELELNLTRAGMSDDLRFSPDYQGLERLLRTCAETKERRLLEHLAEDLAHAALAFSKKIRAVTLRVRKKPAVMPKTGAVIVLIRRSRKD